MLVPSARCLLDGLSGGMPILVPSLETRTTSLVWNGKPTALSSDEVVQCSDSPSSTASCQLNGYAGMNDRGIGVAPTHKYIGNRKLTYARTFDLSGQHTYTRDRGDNNTLGQPKVLER